MKTIETTYDSNNYSIIVGNQVLQEINNVTSKRNIWYIDQKVYEFHNTYIDQFIKSNDELILLEVNEELKSLNQYSKHIERLLMLGIDRDTTLIAVGGGVVSDFVGFLAGTALRGIRYINVATTILAHDSSVGGKVALNSISGKNLIGLFKRPSLVIFDAHFIQSLSHEERLNGYAEIIKMMMLTGRFNEVITKLERFKSKSLESLMEDVNFAIQLKRDIVSTDEKENNLRAVLNLGHTLGHAIEYQYKVKHGYGVAIGVLFDLWLSVNNLKENSSNRVVQQLEDILSQIIMIFNKEGYPLEVVIRSIEMDKDNSIQSIVEYMKHDKKNKDNKIACITISMDKLTSLQNHLLNSPIEIQPTIEDIIMDVQVYTTAEMNQNINEFIHYMKEVLLHDK